LSLLGLVCQRRIADQASLRQLSPRLEVSWPLLWVFIELTLVFQILSSWVEPRGGCLT